jgi:CRP-like cAMP-binding protein
MGLPASLKSRFRLPEKLEEALAQALLSEDLPKGHLLFRKGEECRRIFFIEKGLARVFHTSSRDKDITLWFSAENTFLTPLDSFARDVPTGDNCELLEPSIVHSCEFTRIGDLMMDHPEMAMAGFFIAMELLKQFSDLMANQKFRSAQERFERLVESHRDIFLRAQLGHIASHLGITQETLSRIRAKRTQTGAP